MSIYDDFIIRVLNIDADSIKDVNATSDDNGNLSIEVKVNYSDVKCPVCKGSIIVHGYNQKKITHSIFNNKGCLILFNQARFKCKKCDLTFSQNNPFAKRNEKVSHETKLNILNDLKRAANTYSYVSIKNNVTATEVQKIFDKYVDIQRHKMPMALSIDENYFPESDYNSLYMCIFMDFETGEIVDILPDRKKDYLISYLSNIKNETLDDKTHLSELNNVKYVSIDLNDVYREVAKTYLPKALICGDPFHVIKNLNFFFNKARLRCRQHTDDETLVYLLTKFDFVLYHNTDIDNEAKYNKRLGKYINYRGIRDYLFEAFPDLKKAYELKEEYMYFNANTKLINAKEELSKIVEKFGNCNIKEYVSFYNLLINWFDEIVNSFTIVNGKRINNSYIESRNKNIETLMFNANGLINFKRARNRIMYCINKTDTYRFK